MSLAPRRFRLVYQPDPGDRITPLTLIPLDLPTEPVDSDDEPWAAIYELVQLPPEPF